LAAVVGSLMLLIAFASCIGFVSVAVYSESRWRGWLIMGLIGLACACVYQGLNLLIPAAIAMGAPN
jgi:hypothetical protein